MARITGPLTKVSAPVIVTPVKNAASPNRVVIEPNGPKTPITVEDGYYNIDVVNQPVEVDPINLKGDIAIDSFFQRGGNGGGGAPQPPQPPKAPAGVLVLKQQDEIPSGTPSGTVIVRI